MDQRQNNLDRIRAFDAEEGEWRTINGAHVLIKNGRIAAGAGGALNGQKFQGHSIKKMPAGMTGRNHGYLAEKYSREYDMNRSKAIEERDRARNENGGLWGAMYAATGFGSESKEQQYWDRMKEAGRKIDQLEERPFRMKKYLAAHPELRRGGRAAPQTAAPSQNSTPTSSNHRLKRMPAGYTGKNYKNEVKRLEHNAKVYQRTARKAYEKAEREARPLGEAARIPQSQLPDYKRKLAEKMDKRDNDAIDARLRHERMQERIRAMRQKRPDIFGKAGRASASAPAPAPSSAPAPSAPATPAAPSQNSTPTSSGGRLKRMPAGYTGKNYGQEAKRLDHNARVYERTARLAMEKKEGKMAPAISQARAEYSAKQDAYERAAERLDNRRRSQKWKSGRGVNGTQKRDMHYNHLQNLNSERRGNQAAAARTRVEALEQELGDYKDKMSAGVSSRYSSASAAKNRLASMRKMAKALKQSHPEMFEKVHALKSKMSGR